MKISISSLAGKSSSIRSLAGKSSSIISLAGKSINSSLAGKSCSISSLAGKSSSISSLTGKISTSSLAGNGSTLRRVINSLFGSSNLRIFLQICEDRSSFGDSSNSKEIDPFKPFVRILSELFLHPFTKCWDLRAATGKDDSFDFLFTFSKEFFEICVKVLTYCSKGFCEVALYCNIVEGHVFVVNERADIDGSTCLNRKFLFYPIALIEQSLFCIPVLCPFNFKFVLQEMLFAFF